MLYVFYYSKPKKLNKMQLLTMKLLTMKLLTMKLLTMQLKLNLNLIFGRCFKKEKMSLMSLRGLNLDLLDD